MSPKKKLLSLSLAIAAAALSLAITSPATAGESNLAACETAGTVGCKAIDLDGVREADVERERDDSPGDDGDLKPDGRDDSNSESVDPWTEYCIKKYPLPDQVVECILFGVVLD